MLKKPLAITICSLAITASLSTATLFTLQLTGAINIFADTAHIEFRNYDNTLLYKNDIPIGTYAVYEGEKPTKGSTDMYDYTFTTWDKPLNNIVKDTIFYAQFQNHPREFKVTFLNYNFSTLYVSYVARGETAQFIGTVPTRESDETYSYTFTGWDKPLTNIQEETVFTAQYDKTPIDYKVDFRNWDGTLLYTTYVNYGDEAIYKGITPTKEGTKQIDYAFSGWDQPIDFIKSDTTVYALFDEVPVSIPVTFVNYNSEELYVDLVSYGGTAKYEGSTPQREPDDDYVYHFIGWDKELTNICEQKIITAQYEKEERKYTVKFYSPDGDLLYTSNVKYNHAAFYNGSTPIKESDVQYDYTFSGWDRDLTHIVEDTITYPTFDKTLRKYWCTFVNYDGTILQDPIEVEYGKTAVYLGDTPVKDVSASVVYKFEKWDPDPTFVTGDTVFTAQFEPYESGGGGGPIAKVMFADYNGTYLDCSYVKPDEYAEFNSVTKTPNRPNSSGFTNCVWTGEWSKNPLTGFEENATVFALYTCDQGPIIQYRSNKYELLYEEAAWGWTSYGGSTSFLKEGEFISGWYDQNGGIYDVSFYTYGEPKVVFPIISKWSD